MTGQMSCQYTTYIAATPAEVWQALTDPELSAAWWAHRNVSDWRPGSPWEHRRLDGSAVDIAGSVVEADPPARRRRRAARLDRPVGRRVPGSRCCCVSPAWSAGSQKPPPTLCCTARPPPPPRCQRARRWGPRRLRHRAGRRRRDGHRQTGDRHRDRVNSRKGGPTGARRPPARTARTRPSPAPPRHRSRSLHAGRVVPWAGACR